MIFSRGKACRSIRPFRGAARRFESLERRDMLSANVLNYRYDQTGSGVNTQETTLTPANVNVGSFGKIATAPVDGQVYAQPLYVEGVNIAGGVHNVVYVATEHDSVYAIDSDNGAVLWHDSFINPAAGVTTVPNGETGNTSLSPELGITSTPVIDAATNTLYAVANTKEVRADGVHYVYRMHAIDLSTGAEKMGGPLLIGDTLDVGGNFTYLSGPSVAGTGDDSVNGVVTFNALHELCRPGLTLADGNVLLAFSSHADSTPGHGWIVSVNAQTLEINGVLCTTPNGTQGGIWQDGDAITTTGDGFYVSTGNGTFDSTLNAAGFPVNGDYADSLIKFSYDPDSSPQNPNANGWGLKIADYFTPANEQFLEDNDKDLGSGGIALLPPAAGGAADPNLLVQGGKQGTVYLVNRDDMSGFHADGDQVVQEAVGMQGWIFSTPAYFNGQLYYAAVGGHAEAFSLTDGRLSTTPSSVSPDTFGFPGATPSISANGAANGIVWLIDTDTDQLRAYDAANLSHELYNSGQAPGDADKMGAAVKFSVPTVADGHVFVGSQNSLVIYGLLGGDGGGGDGGGPDAANRQFIAAAYQDALGRPVDPASLAAWSFSLDHGMPRSSLSFALTHSDEYYHQVIDAAYEKFLGREADPAGLANWTAMMRAGLSDELLEAGFIGSSEYYNHSGGTDKAWVDAMYHDLLGRSADSAGEAAWTQALAAGEGRVAVAFGFAASAEREGQRIRADYQKYLSRGASDADVASWVRAFETGFSNENVVAGFLASDEYFAQHS